MSSKNKNPRRQFLKNTSLAALGIGLSPTISKAENSGEETENSLLMCDKTTLDYYGEGPFYTDNPPVIADNQLAAAAEPGDRMIISGRVYNLDCSEYLPDTIIDIWHADHEGAYDNSGGYHLRGKTTSNAQGFYMFETIKPGKYLNGSDFRPAHIHFKITPPNFPLLTTQLYFEGDPDLASDSASSITSGEFDASHRIIALTMNANGVLEGTWDVVINGSGVSGVNDIHIDKGMIYSADPNPFTDEMIIKYGVFRKAAVSLLVYNMEGKMVANLAQETLAPEKYEAVWTPDNNLPDGHYFIALKVNDLQVHYMKVVKNNY